MPVQQTCLSSPDLPLQCNFFDPDINAASDITVLEEDGSFALASTKINELREPLKEVSNTANLSDAFVRGDDREAALHEQLSLTQLNASS